MKVSSVIFLFLCLFAFCPIETKGESRLIHTADQLNACLCSTNSATRHFSFEAIATSTARSTDGYFAVEDATGFAALWANAPLTNIKFRVGDRLLLKGYVEHSEDGNNYALATRLTILSHGQPPIPPQATFGDINGRRHLNRVVRTEGTVLDAFRDEIDPRFLFLILSDGQETLYVSSDDNAPDAERFAFELIGARVAITGLSVDYRRRFARKTLGHDLAVNDLRTIIVLKPAPADPFDVPMLEACSGYLHLSRSDTLERKKVCGRVTATWQQSQMIVQTASDEFVNVRLADPDPPACGETVEVVGLPETDFYRWNLSRGRWRRTYASIPAEMPPQAISLRSLMSDGTGRTEIKIRMHGHVIRITGRILSMPNGGNGKDRILLDSDGITIPVDIGPSLSALTGLECNCKVEVTGVCVMETQPWSPQVPFPHIDGMFLACRRSNDIVILSHPPFWTPGRLLCAVCALLVILLAIGIWNRILQKLVIRKSRQLFKEQIVSAQAKMRLEERTRLAVELHDSLSQNLTGISMQINAAEWQLDKWPEKTRRHLAIASRTLDSCRAELRNCIWDLRNQALEETDINEAIRMTLEDHVEGADLQIRFNIPRARLSDNTAHALIRIVRELATNAVRHGKAKTVRVAGAIDKGQLLFSVSDNGSGFDLCNHPGASDGHFGLQGVCERVKSLQGKINITSSAGKGTKVTVSIPTHI